MRSKRLSGLGFMALQLATQTLAGAIAGPAERARNFSLLSIGFAAANLTGQLVTGVLIDQIGYANTFGALAGPLVPAIVVAALGSRWIPPVAARGETARGGFVDLLKIKGLRDALLASGIVSSALDVYQFFMPVYGHAQGLSATAIGVVMSALGISIILVRMVVPFAVHRYGEAQLLTAAMFVACVAFALDPVEMVVATGQKRRPAWRAERHHHECVSEPHAFSGQPVEVGRLAPREPGLISQLALDNAQSIPA